MRRKNSFNLFGNNFSCVKYPEINTKICEDWSLIGSCAKFFCSVRNYFDGTSAPDYALVPMYHKYNLGQKNDVAEVQKTFDENKLNTKEKFFALGISRGSTSLLNWVGSRHARENNLLTNCAGLILEGTPTSLSDIIEFSEDYKKLYYLTLRQILLKFTAYTEESIYSSVINSLEYIPKDLPILIISSYGDQVVPYQCSVKLYQELIKRRFTCVKLILLKNAGHNSYTANDDADRVTYIEALKSFVKRSHYRV
jgi:predicted alpha/beta-fold hydrolase